MHTVAILLAASAIGVDYGWQPDASGPNSSGQVEYIIQIEPSLLALLREGEPIISRVPPEVGPVRSFRIQVGNGELPRELPPRAEPQGVADGARPLATGDGAWRDPSLRTAPQLGGHAPDEVDDAHRAEPPERVGDGGNQELAGDVDLPGVIGAAGGQGGIAETDPVGVADGAESQRPERPRPRWWNDEGEGPELGASPRADGGPAPIDPDPFQRPLGDRPAGFVEEVPNDDEAPNDDAQATDASPRNAANDGAQATDESPDTDDAIGIGIGGRFSDSEKPEPLAGKLEPNDSQSRPLDWRPDAAHTDRDDQRTQPKQDETAASGGSSLVTEDALSNAAKDTIRQPATQEQTADPVPAKPWVPLVVTALLLFVSVAGNVYLGWLGWGVYARYRALLSESRAVSAPAT